MTRFHEKTVRSFIKAVTFRVLIVVTDSVVIYMVTKRLDLTIGVIILSNISSTLIYFVHERIWNNIHWGKAQI